VREEAGNGAVRMDPVEELLVRGGHIVTAQGVLDADLLLRDGRIAALGFALDIPGVRGLDASGMLVFPGAVDEHVHSREPGMTAKEDFSTMTRAAAAGGVTTVADMPNTIPPVDSAERIAEKGRMWHRGRTSTTGYSRR